MNCKKCGSPLEPNAVSCKNCGTTVDVLIPGTPGVTPISSAESIPAATPEVPAQPAQPVTPTPEVPVAQTVAPVVPTQPVQQPMPAPVMPAMPGQPVPQNNGGKNKTVIIAVVAIIAIAVVAIVLYFTVFNKKDDNNKKNTNSNSTSNTSQNTGSNTNTNSSNTNTNTNVQPSGNTYSISNNGFTFQIPMQYQAQVEDGWLMLTDNSTWSAGLNTLAVNFDSLSVDQVKENLSTQYTNYAVEAKTINGRNYIVAKIVEGTQSLAIAYTKANSLYTYGIMILESPEILDTLEILDGILSTAKSDNNGLGLDASKFSELDAIING